MEGLNEHLREQAEQQAQMSGGRMGGGSPVSSGGGGRDTPVTGDIVGFAGVKLENRKRPE